MTPIGVGFAFSFSVCLIVVYNDTWLSIGRSPHEQQVMTQALLNWVWGLPGLPGGWQPAGAANKGTCCTGVCVC